MAIDLLSAGPIVSVAANSIQGFLGIEIIGEWSGADFRSCETRDARLFIFGHCLLGAVEMAVEFGAAAESRQFDRVAEWPGAYAVIIVRPGIVTAHSDLAGQFPLFFSQQDGELLISPDPTRLASAHQRGPDPLALAAHIACPGVLPMWWGRSAYHGIDRLEGGTVLRAQRGHLEIEPAGYPKPVPGLSMAEGADRLRVALTQGVRARCAGRLVSADFSGGLDSSSIAFLAADVSAAPVASVVYHQPLAPAADLADATRLARLTPAIDLTVVRGSAGTLPFAGLLTPADAGVAACGTDVGYARTAEPSPRSLTARRDAARLAVAAQSGARLHLTGEGGDAVLLASPAYLADLARQHALKTMWRHCGEYARLRHVGQAALATSAIRLAGTSSGAALQAVAAQLAAPAPARAEWADLVSWWPGARTANWLSRGLRRQLADVAGDPQTARAVPAGVGPADLAALADLRRSGDAQRQLRALGHRYGMAVHAPFLDTAAVRAALAVPAVTRADPWSYKPLLQSALTGLVPSEVFARRTKGDYSAEDYRGARRAITELRTLLRDSRLADLGVIEPGPVLAALDRMVTGIGVPLGPLNTLLATELWLRTMNDGREGVLSACSP
jgi:asparagine synthase (glutamine-hydrolysing)